MATKAWVAKMAKPQKFAVRYHNRCQICGRARGYYRDFGLCRICFRMLALKGELPGVTKVSVNFMAQKMILEADDAEFESVLREAAKTIAKVEPDCKIVI